MAKAKVIPMVRTRGAMAKQLLSCDVVLGPLIFKIINWPRDVLEDVVLSLAIRYSERPRLQVSDAVKAIGAGQAIVASRRPVKKSGRKAA